MRFNRLPLNGKAWCLAPHTDTIHQAPRIAESSHQEWLVPMAPQTVNLRKISLADRLTELSSPPPSQWLETGLNARPNLHGLLRYPAMMVPRMQGDIIDTILASINGRCDVLDPFVGSGTMMTEAMIRGLDFTGVDINPLAVLVCEAKKEIDHGADIEKAASLVLDALAKDRQDSIDVDYQNREKWFSNESAEYFSKIRRAILKVDEQGARKVLWAVFAEIVRLCSNSRPSTYKLHIRKPGDRVGVEKISALFRSHLDETVERVKQYRSLISDRGENQPLATIICDDIRRADLNSRSDRHQILVTSPPYGDNQTTIPYGQFSYLALRWIPREDLPRGFHEMLLANTHSLDSASLGGSVVNSDAKQDAMRAISSTFDQFVSVAIGSDKEKGIRKVSSFVYDFYEALKHIREECNGQAHWALTTGNRTAVGLTVPFDEICRDIISSLGGRSLVSLKRCLPVKRMPSRNSMGVMITTETTLVAEFS